MEKSELPSVVRIVRDGSIVFLLLVFLTTCYYDNEENLNPDFSNSCNLTTVTFTGNVKPFLQSFCLSCHSSAVSSAYGGGIRLESYSDVKTTVSNGKFYGSVSHASGYSAMPKGGSVLDACTLQQLKKWIDDGAVNN